MSGASLAFCTLTKTLSGQTFFARPFDSAGFCGLALISALAAYALGAYTLNAQLDPYEWRWRRRVQRPLAALAALLTATFWSMPASFGDDALSLCLRGLFGAEPSETTARGVLALLLFTGGLGFANLAYVLRPRRVSTLFGLAVFFGAFWLAPSLDEAFAAAPLRLALSQLLAVGAAQLALALAFLPKRRLLPYALLPLGLWALALSPAALALLALFWPFLLLYTRAPQLLLLNAHIWLSWLALVVFGLPGAVSALPAWLFLDLSVFWGPALFWPLLVTAALLSALVPRPLSERRPFLLAFVFAAVISIALAYGLPGLFVLFGPFGPLLASLLFPLPPSPSRIVHR